MEKVYFTVINKKDGSKAVIGEKKLKQEMSLWEVIAIQDISKDRQPVYLNRPEPKPEPANIEEKIEEFLATDVDLSAPSASDFEYFELLAECKKLGCEVKGNPKREVLESLYNEAIG